MTLEHAEGDVVAEISGAAASEDGAAMPGRARQRRLWSCAEKRALVDLASAAGSSVTEVAQAFGVAASQLYAWRKQMAGGELDVDQAMATFARIEVNDLPEVERPVADCPDPAGRIVVAFPNGARLRIDGTVDPTALRIVLSELTR
ncbi:transposase [Mesorhizobium sp. M8A.F.Ca.ET.165.01.1.1]|uniref:IS66-like element accessory protein TnpA n=1 Tax=Mesorhizobium sp. M8A.F.Ca.ET.165.01.1.1 TaxID=2563960 RepID=UPI0010939A80|nr:transposase [Mesorhizobium sp. M8A.F.Ca.ET.165.01.1.1]TGT35926.1 IS66 family insertion sequence element accessory protein TnpB [Mesorhizobium sp. M8A.F.Ca.ET.165.01.1.1]